MKRYLNVRILFMVSMLATLGFMSSCDSDDEGSNNGEVTLLSFGPTGAMHGDDINFVGTNLDKVIEIEFAGAIVPKASFVKQTSDIITVTIPQEAFEGPVKLRTPDKEIVSKTVFSMNVPVGVESFTMEAKPGENFTVTGDHVNWIQGIIFSDGVPATELVSISVNEIVVKIPLEAQSGQVTFLTGGTVPEEIRTEESIALTLPAITALAPTTIERGSELTITGTDLDLVAEVAFKGGVVVSASEFISHTPTEIVVVFPEEANKGTVDVVAFSGIPVESAQSLTVVGDLPPLEALAVAFYTDALANGWQKWGGWGGGSADLDNAENVRDGVKAVKVVFVGGWGGAFQLGGATSSTASRDHFAISIFGTPGTGGKQVNLILKNGAASTEKIITIVEGEWTEYKFTIAGDLGGMAAITELFLQDRDWSGTLYVDHIGLR
jgi:hypothetical protein